MAIPMSILTSKFRWLALVSGLSALSALLISCGTEAPATDTPMPPPTSTPAGISTPTETQQPTAVPSSTSPPVQTSLEVGHEVGQKAPGFMLTTVEGEQVTLDSLQGRPLVLYFYATW